MYTIDLNFIPILENGTSAGETAASYLSRNIKMLKITNSDMVKKLYSISKMLDNNDGVLNIEEENMYNQLLEYLLSLDTESVGYKGQILDRVTIS